MKKLCNTFERQKKHLEKRSRATVPASRLSARTKIWFVRGNEHIFGSGLARLLELVETAGSLSRAAKLEGMSYRHAWGEIRKAEEHLGTSLLVRNKGGKGGGGSYLSSEGRRLLRVFDRMEERTRIYADKQFAELLSKDMASEL